MGIRLSLVLVSCAFNIRICHCLIFPAALPYKEYSILDLSMRITVEFSIFEIFLAKHEPITVHGLLNYSTIFSFPSTVRVH